MITLRSVEPDDGPFLLRVYASTRADEMQLVPWSDEEKRAFLESQARAQHSDYTTRFPDSEHSIVMVGPEPVGRIWVDRRPDEIRLLDIAILPDHRSTGIGTDLIGQLQDEARVADLPLRHSVEKDNTSALRLYERLGFTVVEDWGLHDLMEWLPAQAR